MMSSQALRRLVGGVSLTALLALGACSSSGRGAYLAGDVAARSTPPEATETDTGGDTATDGGTNTGGGGGGGAGTGTGGGSGGTETDGGDDGGTFGTAALPGERRGSSGLIGLTDGLNDLTGGVLHTVGNAVLVTPPVLGQVPALGGVAAPLVQTAGETVRDTGGILSADGLGTAVNAVVGVDLNGRTVAGGSGERPVAVAILSPNTANGSIVGANVLSGGQTLAVSLGQPTTGATPVATNGVANGLLGGQVAGGALGGATAPLIGLNVLSPGQTAGTLATVGVAAGGQPATLALGNVAGGLAGTGTGTGGLLAPVTGLLGGAGQGGLLTPVTGVVSSLTGGVGVGGGVSGGLLAGVTTPAGGGTVAAGGGGLLGLGLIGR